ncbi:MAG: adenylate/guanylate cyclase domain-containing protein [Cyanobacteriota bacterium]|nr:adenylate/guanylate cyclase domain-containing protein [Cyanobacteriota bacterium]
MTTNLDRASLKIPLRLVLVVPFLLQIFAAVGLTGWFSFKKGQRAIEELAGELMKKVAANVEQRVETFADTPHLFLQVNQAIIRAGSLNLKDYSELQQNFWHQTQISPAVPYIYYASVEGEFIGVRQEIGGGATFRVRTRESAPNREIYRLDDRGNLGELIKSHEYDPRLRPWHKQAVKTGTPTWSPIYHFAVPPSLGITSVAPIYDRDGKLEGVLASDLTLWHIGQFMRQLQPGKSGKVFIIESSGEMVASSSKIEEPFLKIDGKQERLLAIESQELLIRESLKALEQKYPNLDRIENSTRFVFYLEGKRHFLEVSPLRDGRGLDWLVVVAIPEADFMEQIAANTRITIVLCLAALGVAAVLGLITSSWIGKPILELSKASVKLATAARSLYAISKNDAFDSDIESSSIGELAVLAESFKEMAAKLQISFQQLEQYSQQLEQIVEERTRELQEEIAERKLLGEKLHSSELKMRALFEAMTDIVLVVDREGSVEVIPTNTSLLYGPEIDIIGLTLEQFFMEETGEIWQHQVLRAIDTKRAINYDYSIQLGSRENWFSAKIFPMTEDTAIWVARDISDRKQSELALDRAQRKSESLLLNILPQSIAERLKQDPKEIAEHFDDVTILFSDIVGFTPISSQMSPLELVKLLNKMFSTFDKLAYRHGLEKIKTIGDAYMVAGGLPVPSKNHAEAVADMALEMQAAIKRFQTGKSSQGKTPANLEKMQIRIGINTGPVIAGVIGIKKFIYDLWGDTVNVASRMESSGKPGQIQVSAATYDLLKDKFLFESRGEIDVKGKGRMITYWLNGRLVNN